MSYDIGYWSSTELPAVQAFELAVDGDSGDFDPASAVLDFRAELLAVWEDLDDVIQPFEADPEFDQDDLAKYVVLALPFGWTDRVERINQLATKHGLIGYDPQLEREII